MYVATFYSTLHQPGFDLHPAIDTLSSCAMQVRATTTTSSTGL